MTKVSCKLHLCKHNSSCCIEPHGDDKSYCTKSDIRIVFDEEMSAMDCLDYAMSTTKPTECAKCQVKKYGGIQIGVNTPTFNVIESDDVPY